MVRKGVGHDISNTPFANNSPCRHQTTTLFTKVFKGDKSDPNQLFGMGIVYIEVLDFARQLTTMNITNAPDRYPFLSSLPSLLILVLILSQKNPSRVPSQIWQILCRLTVGNLRMCWFYRWFTHGPTQKESPGSAYTTGIP